MADENFPTNNGEENNTPEQPNVKNISEALANVAVNETLSTEESEVHLPDQPRERASTIATFSPERHSDVLAVVGDSLSEERRDHIKQRSEEIDHLVNQEAIENLPNESLAPEVRRDCNALLAERINPGTLTPEELRKVAAFVNNETDEIREQKFSMTQDLITHSVGGLRNYRDYNFDPKKHAILMDLMDKGEAYDRGLIDTSAGFDIDAVRARDAETYDRHTARYDAAEADYNEDNEDYMSISDRKYFRESFLENMDAEELLEAGLIDEKDLFVYGGYTHRDLEQIEMFCKASYTTGMSPRVNRGVNKLITTAKLAPNESSVSDSESDLFDDLDDDEGLVEEGEKKDYLSTNIVSEKTFRSIIERTIPGHHDSDTVDDMLNCTFVANEILRNRRLDARDLVCLSAAYASRVIQDHPELAKAKIAKKNDETSRLRRRLMYISKCTAGVCGFTPAELRKNYNGLKNPVSADFYSEVITRAEAWTEQQNEAIDINQAAILLRLDETIDDLKADIAAYDFIKAAEAHKADKVPVGIGYANNAG